jgi:hypothetical protein
MLDPGKLPVDGSERNFFPASFQYASTMSLVTAAAGDPSPNVGRKRFSIQDFLQAYRA